MRAIFLMLTGLFVAVSAQAQAPSAAGPSLQSFTWQQNSRFEIRFSQKGGQVVMKGELRDGARQIYQTKDLQTTVEIKSYTTELFVVLAITNEGDETGYIFLLERPQTDWLIMNQTPIRARKLELMNDFETAVKDFKTVTDHTFANVMRKMVEYFSKAPNKRMQDLLSDLEKKDDSLRVLPKPKSGARAGNEQGVIPGSVPSATNPSGTNPPGTGNVTIITPNGQTTYPVPGTRNPTVPSPGSVLGEDPYQQQPQPRRPRREVAPPMDINPAIPGSVDEEQDDWVKQEKERQRRLRRQQQRQQQIDPNTGGYYPGYQSPGYQRPLYPTQPGGYRNPQYAPQQPQYAPRPRGMFESLFGQ